MLLWVLILALFGAWRGLVRRQPARPRCAPASWPCRAMIGVAFLAFILFTSNPFLRLEVPPVQRARPEPAAAGPRPRLPPALPLPRLCRPLDGVLLRRGRPDRGARRCRLGPLGAPLDAGRLGVPDHRHRARLVVGLLRTRLGRLLVLGPGRECLLHALAHRRGAAAFRDRRGKARGAEELDDPARDPRLRLLADRHLHRALGRADLGPRLRQRPRARAYSS